MKRWYKLMISEQARFLVQFRFLGTTSRLLYDKSDFYQEYASLSEEKNR